MDSSTRSREWSRLEQREQQILHRFTEEAPVRLGALANELGLRVRRATLPPGISGEIRPDDEAPSGFLIRVNRHEVRERQRFTVAHEIAHYLLHRDQIGEGLRDDILYRSRLSDRREAEANRLGADIVMPKRLVREAWKNHAHLEEHERIAEVAKAFGVSSAAMRIHLGLV